METTTSSHPAVAWIPSQESHLGSRSWRLRISAWLGRAAATAPRFLRMRPPGSGSAPLSRVPKYTTATIEAPRIRMTISATDQGCNSRLRILGSGDSASPTVLRKYTSISIAGMNLERLRGRDTSSNGPEFGMGPDSPASTCVTWPVERLKTGLIGAHPRAVSSRGFCDVHNPCSKSRSHSTGSHAL
jgi:hypothetical protein